MKIRTGSSATPEQINYIEILSTDLGFNRHTRILYVVSKIRRPINFLDELSKSEASQIISYFKEMKEQK